jgi:hypothetical protein
LAGLAEIVVVSGEELLGFQEAFVVSWTWRIAVAGSA